MSIGKIYKFAVGSVVAASAIFISKPSYGAVISGTISDWIESGPVEIIGDGTNSVSLAWSINTFDKGFFYGEDIDGYSNVAFAAGVTDITQITDASIYTFTSGSIGPQCDADCNPNGIGDFIVWNNPDTGYYGVLRVDDIFVVDPSNPDISFNTALNGTWWFQTDGSGDFSSRSVPEPSLILGIFAVSGIGSAILRKPN